MMRLLKWLLILIVLLVVVAGAAAFWGMSRLREPYKGFAGDEAFVEIPAGAGRTAIEQRLVEAGVVRDAMTFRAAVWLSGRARDLKAGDTASIKRSAPPTSSRRSRAAMCTGAW